jgi:hypothetical protein
MLEAKVSQEAAAFGLGPGPLIGSNRKRARRCAGPLARMARGETWLDEA